MSVVLEGLEIAVKVCPVVNRQGPVEKQRIDDPVRAEWIGITAFLRRISYKIASREDEDLRLWNFIPSFEVPRAMVGYRKSSYRA